MRIKAEDSSGISGCVRCGSCRSGCPTFGAELHEGASARGRVSLISARRGGELDPGELYYKHIIECTLCGSCASNCPSGVDTPAEVISERAERVAAEGGTLPARLVFNNVLNSPNAMALASRFASSMQGLMMKDAPVEGSLLSRFPLPFIGNRTLLPELATTPFLAGSEVKALAGEARARSSRLKVGFFVGCGINYLYPRVAEAALSKLKASEADVFIPQGQVCCGMPAVAAGYIDAARDMAVKNLELFEPEQLDYVTTACASCGDVLKNTLTGLLRDSSGEIRARAAALSSKVIDITELLTGPLAGTWEKSSSKNMGERAVVTYHDPCHLSRYQGVKDAPRALIEMSGHSFKEMNNPCKCCGFGGGLGTTNYELSMEIMRGKAESIRLSGADVVATACPGCMAQLSDGLFRSGLKTRVVHVVELL